MADLFVASSLLHTDASGPLPARLLGRAQSTGACSRANQRLARRQIGWQQVVRPLQSYWRAGRAWRARKGHYAVVATIEGLGRHVVVALAVDRGNSEFAAGESDIAGKTHVDRTTATH